MELLLDIGRSGMGSNVEMEFAVNMSVPADSPKEFGVLQMRPMVLARESEALNLEDMKQEDLICRTDQALGNGIIEGIFDMVVVDIDRFDRAGSAVTAVEVGVLNQKLLESKSPYLLVGAGRWGTLDPWLGIPVKYDQICGARVIIEAGLKDISVSPSQGSHFFQNITSFMIGYFTVGPDGFVDWDWIRKQKAVEEKHFARHLHFEKPIVVKINGHSNKGIILKPE